MPKYLIYAHNEDNHELIAEFVIENVPYPGLVFCKDMIEFEVVKVRQHVRSSEPFATWEKAPTAIDVTARITEGFLADKKQSGDQPSA